MNMPFVFLAVSPEASCRILIRAVQGLWTCYQDLEGTHSPLFFLAIYSGWTSLLTLVGLGWELESSKLILGSLFCSTLERNQCISTRGFRCLWKGSAHSHPIMIEWLRMVSFSPVMIVRVHQRLSKIWLECPCQLVTFFSEPFLSDDEVVCKLPPGGEEDPGPSPGEHVQRGCSQRLGQKQMQPEW